MTAPVFVDTNVLIYCRDALIVSTAQRTGCKQILTEDLQTGQRFGELVVVSPFETSPDSPGP